MNVNIKQKAKTCSRYIVKMYSYIQSVTSLSILCCMLWSA